MRQPITGTKRSSSPAPSASALGRLAQPLERLFRPEDVLRKASLRFLRLCLSEQVQLLEVLDILGFGKTKFVMDRGFYSEDNINGLYRELLSGKPVEEHKKADIYTALGVALPGSSC